MRPSFITGILSGIVIFIAIILFFIHFNTISKDKVQLIIILFVMGIAIGVHGIQHAYEEIYFNFNPMIGKWKPEDNPNKI